MQGVGECVGFPTLLILVLLRGLLGMFGVVDLLEGVLEGVAFAWLGWELFCAFCELFVNQTTTLGNIFIFPFELDWMEVISTSPELEFTRPFARL